MSYYTKITKVGLAAITAALNDKSKLPITYMAFGDGYGDIPEPSEDAEALVNEVYRTGVNKVSVHDKNKNWLVCEAIIPSAVGGFNIREVGLYDQTGTKLLAVASYPPTYKPTVEEGAAKIQTIRIILQIDNSGNFELVIDPDVVLATTRSLNELKKEFMSSVFSHINDLDDAKHYLGHVVEYNGKHFKVSSEQSKDIRHPIIKSGETYLIPCDHTTLSFKTAGFTLKGVLPNSQDFIKPEINPSSGWSQQGLVIDNVSKSIFITSITVGSTNLDTKVYEYEFENGVVGAMKSQSGILSMAHGDYFAVTIKDDERTLWFYKPPAGSTETSPGGDIIGVKWKAGCSDSDIFVTIPFSAFETTYASELNVSNFDDESIIIQGTYNNIVDIDALYEGRVVIKERRQSIWVPFGGDIAMPVQQRIAIVDTQACLSGVFISQSNSCYYSASNRDGSKVTLNPIHKADASERSEVEGLGFYWNNDTLQFEPYITIWEQRTGAISLYNLASAIQSVPSLARFRYVTNGYTMGQYKAGSRSQLDHPFNIGCHGVLIGGNQHPDRHGNDFKKEDFIIEQWSAGHEGRFGARYLYKNTQILTDADEDVALPSGWRFQIGGTVQFQITADGLNLGHRLMKGQNQIARLYVRDAVKVGSYINTADGTQKPSYVSSSSRVDYGVLDEASLKFGRYNTTTGVATQVAYLNDTVFRPTTTKTIDLGSTGGRWKKGFLEELSLGNLQVHADNTAAKAAGLSNGDVYRTENGQLMVAF